MTMTTTTTKMTRSSRSHSSLLRRGQSSSSSSSWVLLVVTALQVLLAVLVLSPSTCQVVEAKAILGVDLGALYMKVALVQRGAPLEIVTNMHSKRKTEQMILFDAGTRFYGADASSLLARKPQQTPVQMTVMMGRDELHPAVKVLEERHFPVVPTYNATRHGLSLTVDKQDYTPEELVAMVLGHAKDMTKAYVGELGKDADAPIRDVVLTVPSFATVHERRALLDAAALADLNVLGLLDENTAAALQYAMDKQFPDPQVFLFYNMGGTAVQVSVVRFYNYNITTATVGSTKPKEVGALEVLSKAWDSTMGGNSFDHRIVDYLADTFNAHWDKQRDDGQKKDIRTIPRAMIKLRLQANKVKHVLSANPEIPIFMDALHDDIPLNTHMTRDQLENLCSDLIDRATKPVMKALEYANLTLSDITGIELIGGGMRIPKIQANLKEVIPDDMELGLHINADESMALGAAFYGANLSTAFRVRHVGLLDVNPFPIAITLADLEHANDARKGLAGFLFGKNKKPKDDKKKDDAAAAGAEDENPDEPWGKHATILKSFGKLGVKKTIAFTHDKDIQCALDYEESDLLPAGTELPIERYNITGIEDFAKEMEEKKLGMPKIALQFQLTESGLTKLIKAEATVEEVYTVEEEVEVDDDEDGDGNSTNTTTEESDDKKDKGDTKKEDASEKERKLEEGKEDADMDNSTAEASNETASETNATNATSAKKEDKKTKKKKKTILQQKEKKRIHKKALSVKTYNVGKVQPYSPELMEESKAKLRELARKDKERVMLEEARNRVESYVYYIKNKLVDDEENVNTVSTEEQRAQVLKLAEEAEEWMYEDGATADLATTVDKYVEISTPADKIFDRVKELIDRPEATKALKGRLEKVTELMKKWEITMTHVTEEERGEVLAKVEEVKAWIAEKEEAQSKVEPHEDPAFTSAEVPGQMRPIEVLVTKLKKKPKPKPPKKNETDSNATDANATDTNATDSNTTTTDGTGTNAEAADADNESAKEEDGKSSSDSTSKQDDKTEKTANSSDAAKDGEKAEEKETDDEL